MTTVGATTKLSIPFMFLGRNEAAAVQQYNKNKNVWMNILICSLLYDVNILCLANFLMKFLKECKLHTCSRPFSSSPIFRYGYLILPNYFCRLAQIFLIHTFQRDKFSLCKFIFHILYTGRLIVTCFYTNDTSKQR